MADLSELAHNLYPALAALRARGPVLAGEIMELLGADLPMSTGLNALSGPSYSVFGYEEARAALREGDTFSSSAYALTIGQFMGRTILEMRDLMGFGRPPEPLAPFFEMMYDVEGSAYYPAIRIVSDALRLGVDKVTFGHEFALTEEPYVQASGPVEVGTVSAATATYRGFRRGYEVLELAFVSRMSDDVARDWPMGDGRWTVRIEGDPNIETEVQVTTDMDTRRATSIMTAMAPINAIPAVSAASPGVKSHLDLPVIGGGYAFPAAAGGAGAPAGRAAAR